MHLTAQPISVADVSLQGFRQLFEQALQNPPAIYDMRTCHASVFGVSGHYQYSARETIQAVRAYAQSEPLTIKAEPVMMKAEPVMMKEST